MPKRKPSNRKSAFTLVEILVVVGIAGIIIVSGITPLVYTVRALTDARQDFMRVNRERSIVNRLFGDIREIVVNQVTSPVKVLNQDKLGDKANDILLLWTITPTYADMPMGTVVYALPQGSVLKADTPPGLYRWVLSGDIQPDQFVMDDLKPEKARLLLPGVEGVSFSALEDSEWVDNYAGNMPQAFRIVLEYEKDSRTYENWLPKF